MFFFYSQSHNEMASPTVSCSWPGCTREMRQDNVNRHLHNKHYPWEAKPFLCNFCRRGYLSKDLLKEHAKTAKHLHLKSKAEEIGQYDATAVAQEWAENQREEGVISAEEFQRLSVIQLTTEDIAENPGQDTSEETAIMTVERSVSPYSPGAPTTAEGIEYVATVKQLGAIPMETEEAAAESIEKADEDLPATSAVVSNPRNQSRRGSCNSTCSESCIGGEPSPMPSPLHATNYRDREPSRGRRKCAPAVLLEEEMGAKLYILGEHLDRITERLDQLELQLKLKVTEVAQEQSRHLTQEIKSTVATEAYATQNYMKTLLTRIRSQIARR